jgi:hypothetical protein
LTKSVVAIFIKKAAEFQHELSTFVSSETALILVKPRAKQLIINPALVLTGGDGV